MVARESLGSPVIVDSSEGVCTASGDILEDEDAIQEELQVWGLEMCHRCACSCRIEGIKNY